MFRPSKGPEMDRSERIREKHNCAIRLGKPVTSMEIGGVQLVLKTLTLAPMSKRYQTYVLA